MNDGNGTCLKVVLDEFYALIDLYDPELSLMLSGRSISINGLGNMVLLEQSQRKPKLAYPKTPYWDETKEFFDPDREYVRAFSYLDDLALQKLKRSLCIAQMNFS